MAYAIIANPKAGSIKAAIEKKAVLEKVAKRLNAPVFGLDSKDKPEFQARAQLLSNDYDILIVAGGDGTFSDVLNAKLNPKVTLAYLPFGSGNALRYGLQLPTSFEKWYPQFQRQQVKELDVILYNDSYRCFFAGLGFEAQVMQDRQRMRQKGFDGFLAYGIPIAKGIVTLHPRINATIEVDGTKHSVKNVLTISLSKHPYYGYGIRANPYAKWDDGLIHIRPITESSFAVGWRILYSFWGILTPQTYFNGKTVTIITESEQPVQCDGELMGTATKTSFTILPKSIKVIM
ncbi:MAG: diacylglycerol kinase family protein [bacterium]|nr:diacylglycerol kinase family protein [bacterium]